MYVSKTIMPKREEALPDRELSLIGEVAEINTVTGNQMKPPFPEGTEMAMLGMGCFWGAEKKLWQQNGVYSTQVGFANGYTRNPSYEDVCTGDTGHTEVVRVVYDPKKISFEDLMILFWENHDPTEGMKQGECIGTQYRSAVYYYDDEQKEIAMETRDRFAEELRRRNRGAITTEILPVPEFNYAEDYHQQYLDKNPGGFCGLKGLGIPLVKK